MKKFFGEKQTRFAFRKLAVGLVSAAISSLFLLVFRETLRFILANLTRK